MYIFVTCICASVIAFIMATGAYLITRKKDGNHDKVG